MKIVSKLEKEQIRVVKKFLFVPFILILMFFIVPFILMFFYSFTDWDGFSKTFNFIFLDNYKKIIRVDNLKPFLVIFYYIISAFLQFILALFLAYFVYFQKRFKKITFTIILLPIFINTVAIGITFLYVFEPNGLLNSILDIFIKDYNNVKWIGDINLANWSLSFVSIWRYTPYSFLLIYSGLASVNKNWIKSAKIAGANNRELFRYILLPNIKTTLFIVISMLLVGSVTAFEIPTIITGGANNTKTILMRINELAFNMRDFGMASVMSILVVVLILVLLLYIRKKGDKYER